MLLLWIFVMSPLLFINIAANGFGFEQNTNINNTSRLRFPLRVPPEVKAVYFDHKEDPNLLRRPKRSKSGGRKRVKRQLQPGVYSCGHQGKVI